MIVLKLSTAKRVLSYIVTVILTAAITCGVFMFPQLSRSKEERLLDDIMGTYHLVGYVSMLDPLTSSNTAQYLSDKIDKQYLKFNKEVFALVEPHEIDNVTHGKKNVTSIINGFAEPSYLVKQVDNELLNNGVTEQGAALRGMGLVPFGTDANDIQPFYAVFVNPPPAPADTIPPQRDLAVFYRIGNKYYLAMEHFMYELEKKE